MPLALCRYRMRALLPHPTVNDVNDTYSSMNHTLPGKALQTLIMSSAFVPGSQQRYLRACMVCSIVQTHAVSTLRSPNLHPL